MVMKGALGVISMTILLDVLKEEYSRSLRFQSSILKELSTLPKGYISVKKINGKERYYLQVREGIRVKSKYISSTQINELRNQIERRNELQNDLKDVISDLNRLKKALGKDVPHD